jgi:hypothetical protein
VGSRSRATDIVQRLLLTLALLHTTRGSVWCCSRRTTGNDCAAHLDLVGGLEAVQLVEELQHGALHLGVPAAAAVVRACAADAVHLVHEDDGRRVLPAKRATVQPTLCIWHFSNVQHCTMLPHFHDGAIQGRFVILGDAH